MDGNESCPHTENAFKNESKSLGIRAPWEAIILQDSCVVWDWRLVVLPFFMFPIVELNHVIFLPFGSVTCLWSFNSWVDFIYNFALEDQRNSHFAEQT